MCPLYWDFKRDVPITKEEIDDQKLQSFIFTNTKEIPKGKYIFQIFSDKYKKIILFHLQIKKTSRRKIYAMLF